MREIVVKSEEDAWKLVEQHTTKDGLVFPDDMEVRFEGWPTVRVYIRKPKVSGSITPTMMESFIALQDSIYRTVTFIKYGESDLRRLGQSDRDEYEINVEVKKGSSDQTVDLTKLMTDLGGEFLKSMPPEYVVGAILGAGLLWAGTAAWKHYLDMRKEVRLAEVSSAEKQAHLNAMQFASGEETKRVELLANALSRQPHGERVVAAGEVFHDALLKSASNVNDASVLGLTLKASDAQELRASSRRRAIIKIVEQELRVVDVDTSDNVSMVVTFAHPDTNDIYKASIKDAIIGEKNRKAIIEALGSRSTIWVRMRIKELEGEVKSTEIVDVTEAPDKDAAE